ncbi:MAG: sigma-70 family RNA polymerase sigma factor [Acidobacteriota bacterium]
MDKRNEFERLALPHLNPLYNTAVRLLRSTEDAHDLVQETFLRAYRTFANFEAGTNAKAWLFTILYSVFVNRYRKERREPGSVSLEGLEEGFLYSLGAGEKGRDLEVLRDADLNWNSPEVDEALRRLQEEFRAAVLLVDVEGLSYEEAAGVLSCPVGTLRSRLFRARQQLFVELHSFARKMGYLKNSSL